jgi:uncharacterized membrane protein
MDMDTTTDVTGTNRDKNVGTTERILSVASGAIMLMSGLMRIRKTPVKSTLSAATGALMMYRGATGFCFVNKAIGRNTAGTYKKKALDIEETIMVNKPHNEVYAYWRKLENLPKFMKHLKEVREYDMENSHWEARIPGGVGTLQWDAKIIYEVENEALAWRSVEDAMVDNSGEVSFMEVPGQGTIVRVKISYSPPVGEIGYAVSSLFNRQFEQLIREDMHRFKEVVEQAELFV